MYKTLHRYFSPNVNAHADSHPSVPSHGPHTCTRLPEFQFPTCARWRQRCVLQGSRLLLLTRIRGETETVWVPVEVRRGGGGYATWRPSAVRQADWSICLCIRTVRCPERSQTPKTKYWHRG